MTMAATVAIIGPAVARRVLVMACCWYLLSLPAASAQSSNGGGCTLTCQQNAPCVYGEANYGSHNQDAVSFEQDPNGYHCACPHGYTGLTCDVEFETCDGQHTCYNGGQCIPGLMDDYGNEQLFCDCSAATDADGNEYVGKFCEHQAANVCNANAGTFCVNGGECNSQYPDYGQPCLCAPGYDGAHCEYESNTVPDCTLNCKNGGVCILGEEPTADAAEDDTDYAYWKGAADTPFQYCDCTADFDGELCDIPKVKCGSAHCFNGGVCIERQHNGQTTYQCDCTTSWTKNATYFAGRYCQYEATSICRAHDADATTEHLFCTNNGECKDNPYNGCNCQPGYTGFSCEYLTHAEVGQDVVNGTVQYGSNQVDLDGDQVMPPDDDAAFDPNTADDCTLPCQNGGTCRTGVKDVEYDDAIAEKYDLPTATSHNFQHCVCQDGFVGVYCQEEVQVCGQGQHVCLHGGECVTDADQHSCDCRTVTVDEAEGYAGEACEHPATDICTVGDILPSQGLSFCVNGGTCKDRVQAGEPHPGCSCRSGWVGPHCEIARQQSGSDWGNEHNFPNQDGDIALTDDERDDDEGGNGKKIFGMLFALFSISTVSCIAISQALRRRQKKRAANVTSSLRFADRYRDRPPEHEINIAPRRDSTMSDAVYHASISSSRDPMATVLGPAAATLAAANVPDVIPEDDQPVLYMGPPRDEDGHELHSVNII